MDGLSRLLGIRSRALKEILTPVFGKAIFDTGGSLQLRHSLRYARGGGIELSSNLMTCIRSRPRLAGLEVSLDGAT
jgi:hypothetical protein